MPLGRPASTGKLYLDLERATTGGFWERGLLTRIVCDRYMGALSNSGRKAANYAGFYKGIQSAGAAVFWRLDGLKTPYNTMFGATVRLPPLKQMLRRTFSQIS